MRSSIVALACLGLLTPPTVQAAERYFLMSRHGDCAEVGTLKRKIPDLHNTRGRVENRLPPALPHQTVHAPLPGDLQNTLVFAAAIMAGARDASASKALVNFLRTPEAAIVIKAKGMEPATP